MEQTRISARAGTVANRRRELARGLGNLSPLVLHSCCDPIYVSLFGVRIVSR